MIVFDDHWGAVEMLSASESKVPQEWSALYGVPGYPKKISSYAFID